MPTCNFQNPSNVLRNIEEILELCNVGHLAFLLNRLNLFSTNFHPHRANISNAYLIKINIPGMKILMTQIHENLPK